MGRAKPIFLNLLGGQNDTRIEEGLELPRLRVVQNVRLKSGALERRAGMKRLDVAGTDATSLDLTAASTHSVLIPAPAHLALVKPFTLEFLIEPDVYTGTQAIVGFKHATDWPFRIWMDAADIKITLTDSGGNAETVTTLSTSGTAGEQFAIQLAVAADNTYAYRAEYLLDAGTYHSTASTGTLSSATGATLKAPGGDMYLGSDNGGNLFDGHIDYFRAYRYQAQDFDMAWSRWPSPMQPYMACDYGGEIDSNDWVLDRSPYQNHGAAQNSPGTATSLCVNPSPAQAIRSYRDKDNKTRLLVVAGGLVYSAEV